MASRKEYEFIFKLKAALGNNFDSSFKSAMNTTNNLKSSIQAVQKVQSDVSSYQKQKTALESSQKKFALLTEEYDKLQAQMKATAEPSEALRKKFEKNEKQIGETTSKIEAQEKKLGALRSELSSAGMNTSNLSAENERLSKTYDKLKRSQEDLSRVNAAIDQNNKVISKTKSQLIGTIGAIAAVGTAAYVGAIKPAIEFESAFAGVKKTINGTPEQLSAIQQGIRRMATEIPPSVTEISAIAEAAGQLGIQTESILKFTRTMADLGVTTNLKGDEAASTLAKFANITNMSQDNFDRLGSTIVALGNNLATTEADIAAMGLRLAGAGKQVGLAEPQILALSGALSSVGIEAEAGGSAFSKVMVNMQLATEKGGETLKDFASVAGMSSAEFKAAFKKDAAGAITAFIKGLGESEKKGISAIKVLDDMGITEVRTRDALLRAANASELFTNAINLGTTAWEENTALQTEAQQRYATTESSIKIMRNAFKDIGATIGSVFTPQLAETAKKVSEVAVKFADFAKKNPELIKTIAIITAGLFALNVAILASRLAFALFKGNILAVKGAMIAYKTAGGLAGIATKAWAAISATAAGVTTALGAAFTFLTSPIGLIVIAIAAVIAIVVLCIKHWDKVKEVALSAWEAIQSAWGAVATWFGGKFAAAWDAIKTVFAPVGAFFSGIWEIIKEKFTSIGTAIGDAVSGAFKTVVNAILTFAESKINGFINGINTCIGVINKIPGVSISKLTALEIPKLAKGSDNTPDAFIAGEKGAELITNARGRTVFTAAQTGHIMQNVNAAQDAITIVSALPLLQAALAARVGAPSVSAPSVTAAQQRTSVIIRSAPIFHVGTEAQAEDIEEKLRQRDEELLNEFDERLRLKEDDERRRNYD